MPIYDLNSEFAKAFNAAAIAGKKGLKAFSDVAENHFETAFKAAAAKGEVVDFFKNGNFLPRIIRDSHH